MSENFYRIMHYSALFFFLSGLGITFFTDNSSKINKIASGIASLLVFVAGMGLIAKALQIGHGSPWPMWIKIKIAIWLALAVGGPVLGKRLQSNRVVAFYALLVVACSAAYLAVMKPF